MLKLFNVLMFLGVSTLFGASHAMDFDLIKKGQDDNNTLFVIGGIHGDEPGGFLSASILSTHYSVSKGSLWIVPNLNFYSILKKRRGYFGDMNRKFSHISKKDTDYDVVQKIQKLITNESVKLIVSLHDGSGYYREKYINALHQPKKWGQCSVIEEKDANLSKYGNLEEISKSVVEYVNKKVLNKEDKYRVHNTHTAKGNLAMSKSLTFYAVENGKAAFGNESSKNLPVVKRVYYHLVILEKYMKIVGIDYKRDFPLTLEGVQNAMNENLFIVLYNNKIKLPLSHLRDKLGHIPVTKDLQVKYEANSPLIAVVKKKNSYQIRYGNRGLTTLQADYMDYDESNETVELEIDGKVKKYSFGSIIDVKKEFLVKTNKNFRVNVIGYVGKNKKETDIKIKHSNIIKKYSIDKSGKMFRIEYYKNKKFSGMILVNFK